MNVYLKSPNSNNRTLVPTVDICVQVHFHIGIEILF